MAGSKLWFAYTTDQGAVYGINCDEGNTKQLNGTVGRPLPAGLIDALPRNVRPRKAYYQSTDGLRTITCYALTPAILGAAASAVPSIPDPLGGGSANSNLFYLNQKGESRRAIKRGDTGLTDGSADAP